jgi:hypothetical protein
MNATSEFNTESNVQSAFKQISATIDLIKLKFTSAKSNSSFEDFELNAFVRVPYVPAFTATLSDLISQFAENYQGRLFVTDRKEIP